MLEQVLRMYEIEDRVIGEIYTSGLEMYTGVGGVPKLMRAPSAPGGFGGIAGSFGPIGPSIPSFRAINPMVDPILDGGLEIDFDNTTKNTLVLKEEIGLITNTYLHHDRGSGRVETKTVDGFLNRYNPKW